MARVWQSGDEYTSTLDGGLWDSVTGTVTVGGGFARTGYNGSRVNPLVAGSHYRVKWFAPVGNTNDVKYGFAIQPKVRVDTLNSIVIIAGDVSGISLRSNPDGTLELWDDVGLVQLGGDSPVLALDGWYWINLTYIDSTGAVSAKLNGVEFGSGNAGANGVMLELYEGIGIDTPATGEFYFDDRVINDQTGASETGDPEDQSVVILRPNGAGDSADGSRGGTDTGTDYGQLSEDPPDDATTYYILDLDGDRIEVNADPASIWLMGRIVAVQSFVRHRADSAAIMTYRATLKSQSGGTRAVGNTISHNDVTWKTNGDVFPRLPSLTSYVDPQNGGPWTSGRLDQAQPGIEVVDATPDMWLTSLALLVAFIPSGVVMNPLAIEGANPLGLASGPVRV